MFLLFQGGASVLSRLVGAARTWAGGGGEVRVLSVQPMEGRIPTTRVWLSTTGITNLDYLLLYHKNEVIRDFRRICSGRRASMIYYSFFSHSVIS